MMKKKGRQLRLDERPGQLPPHKEETEAETYCCNTRDRARPQRYQNRRYRWGLALISLRKAFRSDGMVTEGWLS